MANYVSLDEAAKILGISTDELVEMRSRGEIFGYRDGTSWKFKSEEIERVVSERNSDALDEEAGGSSILVSERQVGPSGSKSGSTIGGRSGGDSELKLADDDDKDNAGSDVALVADPNSGSGVRLVNRSSKTPPLNTDLGGSGVNLGNDQDAASSDIAGVSDLQLNIEGGSGSDVELGSDLNLMVDASSSGLDLMGSDGSDVLAGSDIASPSGSGTPSLSKASSINLGSGSGDLNLASDDEDDLVLGSDSGVGLGSDSGINLMSPSDSGLSLEDEPLDLAGTGISGLDLGAEIASGSGSGSASAVGSGSGISGLGSGALIDFQQGEEFQLTPSGGIEAEDDSGSQVIELEDSSEFGGLNVGGPDMGLDPISEQQGGFDAGEAFGDDSTMAGTAAGAAMRGIPETPYSGTQVVVLLLILLLMGFTGILTSDIVRNMWAWDGQDDFTSGLTGALLRAMGSK